MRALVRSAFAALMVAAVVLVATFAAEMSAIMIWTWSKADTAEGGLGAVSVPDVAIPLALLAFIATFGWRVIRWRRAAARTRAQPPAS